MNSTLNVSADAAFGEGLLQESIVATENAFATVPVPVIKKAVYQRPDEEELHTSFEEAISYRLLAMESRLSRLSNPMLNVQCSEQNTDCALSADISTTGTTVAKKLTQNIALQDCVERLPRPMIFVGLATLFILSGFDLMGLLMLLIH